MDNKRTTSVILGEMGAVPIPENIVQSNPPSGKYRVANLYVNENGKLIVEWDDQPVS